MENDKYYQDEIAYLREFGKKFADDHPQLSRYLAEPGSDPDVERLLEGFAFLTGRLRQKLDDELPELSHSLIQLMWPHYLRIVPSMTILQFTPEEKALTDIHHVARDSEIASVPIDGVSCLYRTSYPVDVAPLAVRDIDIKSSKVFTDLDLSFAFTNSVDPRKLHMDHIRLHLHGEKMVTQTLYLWLFRFLEGASLHLPDGTVIDLKKSDIAPVGFERDQGLLPYPPNVFSGYRYLQEYFTLPEKFLFFDVLNIKRLFLREKLDSFTLKLRFSRPIPPEIRLQTDHFRLFCTPAVNLFSQDAEPIHFDNKRVEYRVRPSGGESFTTVYVINQVKGWSTLYGPRTYPQFESFDHHIHFSGKQGEIYYRQRAKPSVRGYGFDHYVSFVTASSRHDTPAQETVSLELTCANIYIPEQLGLGEINKPVTKTLPSITVSNITLPTAVAAPALDGDLQWRLINNQSLNYMTLNNVETIRSLLAIYDFRAAEDRQAARVSHQRLEGIEDIHGEEVDRIYRGRPVRGTNTQIQLRQSKFAGEGDLFLFATILSEFLALSASVNSFSEMTVLNSDNGESYTWPAKIGLQPIL